MTALSLHRPKHPWLWATIVGAAAALVALATLAPLLSESAYWAVHGVFSPVCHQIAERSFHLGGRSMLLCVRCTGVFGGFLLSASLAPVIFAHDARIQAVAKAVVVGSLVLIGLEWLADFSGFYGGNQGARFVTGAIFGLVAGYLTVRSTMSSTSAREGQQHTYQHQESTDYQPS